MMVVMVVNPTRGKRTEWWIGLIVWWMDEWMRVLDGGGEGRGFQ